MISPVGLEPFSQLIFQADLKAGSDGFFGWRLTSSIHDDPAHFISTSLVIETYINRAEHDGGNMRRANMQESR